MSLYEIYFSPTGGTKKVADIMIKAMKKDAQEIDMIKDPDKILQTEFSEDDICLIAVPSYGGRIPSVTVDKFQKLQAKGTKAILVAVFGNRAIDDTLVEMQDILENADEDKISVTDFSEVKGQVMAKRAMEIAAAGYHNLMLGGPPGVGKSMLASCISGIMPQMTTEEMIDTTIIYSAKGLLKDSFSLITKRPFRNPSLAVTQAGMFGGGMTPQPGEISLAHHGILFLDEFPEYKREIIEMLRVPLEKHEISIVRKEQTLTFPADFLLSVCANSCPCGYYPMDKCRCTYRQIVKYQNRISGPILDRIDLFVRCEEIGYEALTSNSKEESSADIRKRVSKAWEIQKERFAQSTTLFNGRMNKNEVEIYCKLDEEGKQLMKEAFSVFQLTGRSYFKILKVARTIADLEGSYDIKSRHVEEALYFRQKGEGRVKVR